jgi:hypothetical protein
VKTSQNKKFFVNLSKLPNLATDFTDFTDQLQ